MEKKNIISSNKQPVNKPYKNAYFWTQTIRPSLSPLSPNEQYMKTIEDIKRILHGYNCLVYVELTATYTVHYHSIVYMNDTGSNNHYLFIKRIQACIYNYKGSIGKMFTVNPFTSEAEYKERKEIYVNKDKERTLEYLTCLNNHCVYNMAPIDELLEDIITEHTKNNESNIERLKNNFIAKCDEIINANNAFNLNWIEYQIPKC